jgi:hypothetical protein
MAFSGVALSRKFLSFITNLLAGFSLALSLARRKIKFLSIVFNAPSLAVIKLLFSTPLVVWAFHGLGFLSAQNQKKKEMELNGWKLHDCLAGTFSFLMPFED